MGTSTGIFGDPNSGKSILAYHVFKEMLRRGEKVFRQEGDPAAPTSCWFLEGNDRMLCNETRKRIKKPFTTTMANHVRDSVTGLKTAFDHVIVDLGGGQPPLRRVTPELDIIIPVIDRAIVLCPDDGDPRCASAWKRELEERRIPVIRECTSSLAKESLVTGDTCRFGALDRDVARAPPVHLDNAVKNLVDILVKKANGRGATNKNPRAIKTCAGTYTVNDDGTITGPDGVPFKGWASTDGNIYTDDGKEVYAISDEERHCIEHSGSERKKRQCCAWHA